MIDTAVDPGVGTAVLGVDIAALGNAAEALGIGAGVAPGIDAGMAPGVEAARALGAGTKTGGGLAELELCWAAAGAGLRVANISSVARHDPPRSRQSPAADWSWISFDDQGKSVTPRNQPHSALPECLASW